MSIEHHLYLQDLYHGKMASLFKILYYRKFQTYHNSITTTVKINNNSLRLSNIWTLFNFLKLYLKCLFTAIYLNLDSKTTYCIWFICFLIIFKFVAVLLPFYIFHAIYLLMRVNHQS